MQLEDKLYYSIITILIISILLNIGPAFGESTDFDDIDINLIESSQIDTEELIETEVNFTKIHRVLATKYNPVKSQCDNDPLITADNSKIDLNKLNSHKLRWIAVSRDLLEHYSYGDKVLIKSSNTKLNGYWYVHDTMNKRFKNRIDFLVPVNDHYNFNKPIKVHISKAF